MGENVNGIGYVGVRGLMSIDRDARLFECAKEISYE